MFKVVTVSTLVSLLYFIPDPMGQSEQTRWSAIFKLMRPRGVACNSQESDENEFKKFAVALKFFISHSLHILTIFRANLRIWTCAFGTQKEEQIVSRVTSLELEFPFSTSSTINFSPMIIIVLNIEHLALNVYFLGITFQLFNDLITCLRPNTFFVVIPSVDCDIFFPILKC